MAPRRRRNIKRSPTTRTPVTKSKIRKPRRPQPRKIKRGHDAGGLHFTLCPRCGGFAYVSMHLGRETFAHREGNGPKGEKPMCAGARWIPAAKIV